LSKSQKTELTGNQKKKGE